MTHHAFWMIHRIRSGDMLTFSDLGWSVSAIDVGKGTPGSKSLVVLRTQLSV
jgi:hypothetical protein